MKGLIDGIRHFDSDRLNVSSVILCFTLTRIGLSNMVTTIIFFKGSSPFL